MSLLRLLSAGKSLVGVKDTARYRMGHPGMLPKFGSARNPFGQPKPGQGESGTPPEEQAQNHSSAEEIKAEPACEGETRTADRPVTESVAPEKPTSSSVAASAVVLPGKVSTKPSLLQRLLKRVRSFLFRRTAHPDLLRRPVQGELSLDNIRVVRNDLSDTDLEVVPLRTGRGPRKSAGRAETIETASNATQVDHVPPEHISGRSSRPDEEWTSKTRSMSEPQNTQGMISALSESNQ